MRLSQGKFYHEKLDLVSNFEISTNLYTKYSGTWKIDSQNSSRQSKLNKWDRKLT